MSVAIKVLSDRVINQIAAGEVVERPLSVVRELVDNALDAEATHVTIHLERGGRSLIRVADDGVGMGKQDALLAFERHATSKIKIAKDLEALTSYGFRGEALASISAVAKVSLRTRLRGEPQGTEVVFVGGSLKDVQTCPCKEGTTIEVRNLFFNTPARKKFLSQEKTEERRIVQWLRGMSLGNPAISFVLVHDEKEVLSLRPKHSTIERARDLFSGSLVDLSYQHDSFDISGIIGHPGMAVGKSSGFTILVNDRVVQDNLVLKAVREGFDNTLKSREYPVGFISIKLPPSLVDINVHPQKSEVRFRSHRDVFQHVASAVSEAVQRFRSPVKSSNVSRAPSPNKSDLGFHTAVSSAALQRNIPAEVAQREEAQQVSFTSAPKLTVMEQPQSSEHGFRFSELKYIGMALKCYLLCEADGELVVIDMHAAHERVNFNRIRNAMLGEALSSQMLLAPVTAPVSEDELAKLASCQKILSDLGIEAEQLDHDTLVIRSCPSYFKGGDVVSMVKEVLADGGDDIAEAAKKRKIDSLAARLACHASVRSGDRVGKEEVYGLFESLDREEFSAACPHGRPVVVSFTDIEVEAWFGRDR